MRILNRLVSVVCSVLALGLLMPVTAFKRAAADQPQVMTPPMDILYAAPGDLNYAYGPQGAALEALTAGDRPASATITVTYNGFSPQAQAAFQAGINIWAATITSPAPIRINANWTPLGSGVLGSAGASAGCTVSGGVPSTFYAAALADKINGSAFCATLGGQSSEIIANFNSTFTDWEFGTTGVGVPGKYNFMTVVMHEVGHGLGFFGRFTSSGGIGNLSSSNPYIYDRFSISGGGTPLLNFARPSASLHTQLVSNNTFWNTSAGPKLETHNMTTAYGFSSDNGWLQGSSYSHVDDVAYSGTANGLMTFALSSNEVYTDIGPVVRTIFTDSGWTVNAGPPAIRTPGDFTGDGHADFATFRPSTGVWRVQGLVDATYGMTGDIPVPGDYNGDTVTGMAVFRPSNGTWLLRETLTTIQWGLSGDIPVPGDYNGDGVTDLAVFRTTSGGGTWFIRDIGTFSLGLRGDIPVPADYDGDGKTDIAVFRPSTGTWYRTFSSTSGASTFPFGLPGDIPVPGKFDADNKADVALYRPSTGTWYISQSLGGATVSLAFGLTGDMPLALDTDGDGVSELTLWRPASGTWFTFNRITAATNSVVLGSVGDIPVMQRPRLPSTPAADFDGDGRTDLTIFRNVAGVGYWYQRFSRLGFSTNGTTQFGLGGDIKVPGDFDGDHKTDYAVFRPSSGVWYILQSATNTVLQTQWGLNGDVPVPADYDGDGRTDLAVYRPGTGIWYVLTSSSNFTSFFSDQWGLPTDVPRPGDYDGDGRADFAVFRPANGIWYMKMTTATYSADRIVAKQFGLGTDISVAQDFDGDGRTDLGLYRGHGQWLAVDAVTSITPINQQLGLSSDTPNAHDYDGDGKADVAIFRPSTGQWFFTQSSNGALQIYQWGLNGDQPVLRVDPWK